MHPEIAQKKFIGIIFYGRGEKHKSVVMIYERTLFYFLKFVLELEERGKVFNE